MKERLKCILLVDDDEPTNFLHKIVLEHTNVSQRIEVAETAKQALTILEHQIPDIIFLDLNMPGMSGWDFIDRYKEISFNKSISPMLFILSTTANPDDKKKADSIKEVTGFKTKPLTDEIVNEIVDQYFFN